MYLAEGFALIGAIRHHGNNIPELGAELPGAAFIYQFIDQAWEEVGLLAANGEMQSFRFGSALAIEYPWFVVGAPGIDKEGYAPGAVYVYDCLNGCDLEGAFGNGEEKAEGKFSLVNYPQPCFSECSIVFSISTTRVLRLDIFDMLGRRVMQLVNGTLPPGTHQATFDATGLPSGMYMYRLEAGEYSESRFIIVVK